MTQSPSERAEGWIHTIYMIGNLGERGSVDAAYRLVQFLQDDYERSADELRVMLPSITALSDGPVPWPADRGYSAVYQGGSVSCWSSAHEAALGLAEMTLSLLLWPLEGIDTAEQQFQAATKLLSDRWKAIAIPQTEAAALKERIRRERVKLAAQPATAQPVETQPARQLEALLGGDETKKVLEIARAKEKSADTRMREICGIDRRHLFWEAGKWADLLDCTPHNIRKTKFWKDDRETAIEAAKALEDHRSR